MIFAPTPEEVLLSGSTGGGRCGQPAQEHSIAALQWTQGNIQYWSEG